MYWANISSDNWVVFGFFLLIFSSFASSFVFCMQIVAFAYSNIKCQINSAKENPNVSDNLEGFVRYLLVQILVQKFIFKHALSWKNLYVLLPAKCEDLLIVLAIYDSKKKDPHFCDEIVMKIMLILKTT